MPTASKENSGKLLILAVLAVGLAAAAVSWWFRYSATHRAAQFWGPDAVLIRDAWMVEFIVLKDIDQDASDPEGIIVGGEAKQLAFQRSVHQARGLLHLRNALLEDRNFDWPVPAEPPDVDWRWGLQFAHVDEHDTVSDELTIWFSSDCRWAMKDATGESPFRAISCRPIANGLVEMFSEWQP